NPPDTPTFVSHGGNTTAVGAQIADDTPDLDWNFSDSDGDPQAYYRVTVYDEATDVLIWNSGDVANSTSMTTCGVTLTNGNTYYWECQVGDGYDWSPVGGGKNIWYFTINISANQPPNIPHTPSPANSEGGVSTSSVLSWLCSDPDGDPLTYDVYLDTFNPPITLIANDINSPNFSPTLSESTIYYWFVIASDGSLFRNGPVWIFATGLEDSDITPGLSPDGPNFNKTAVTETMNLENLESAKLSFWHEYNMIPGANGGFLQVGTNDSSGTWKWRYIIPANAYTGNLRASVWVNDSYGQRIYWCWNGVSGRGTFDWDFVTVNLLNFVPQEALRDEVKVKFNYTQYGGGTGYGWFIDDVRVEVSRSDLINPNNLSQDVWSLTNMSAAGIGAGAHSGYFAWSNFDPVTGLMKPGIDNYLRTMP
ncbi:MAG: hypothetical protein KAX31_07640, partial [Thermoplasmata archaeon]|nr:hypothetical protein [Thermoplasmata archaeon]